MSGADTPAECRQAAMGALLAQQCGITLALARSTLIANLSIDDSLPVN
jgi:hypothetical protein